MIMNSYNTNNDNENNDDDDDHHHHHRPLIDVVQNDHHYHNYHNFAVLRWVTSRNNLHIIMARSVRTCPDGEMTTVAGDVWQRCGW